MKVSADRLKKHEPPFCFLCTQLIKTADATETEGAVLQDITSDTQGLLMTVEASTSQTSSGQKGKKKNETEAPHSKSKKSSKSASRSVKEKDQASAPLRARTFSQHSSSSSKRDQACSSKSVQPSPIWLDHTHGPFSPLFPINTSGLWGSGSDLQGPLLHDVQFGAMGSRHVSATFTPTAAELRPELQLPSMSVPNIQELITSAIAQGIATGLQQRPATAQASTACRPSACFSNAAGAAACVTNCVSLLPVSCFGRRGD